MNLQDPSMEGLIAKVRQYQKNLGYGVIKTRLKRSTVSREITRQDLACDRGGRAKPSVAKERSTKTSKTGCQWSVRLVRNGDGCWMTIPHDLSHNHPPLAKEAYATSRAFRHLSWEEAGGEKAIRRKVELLSKSGKLTARDIAVFIREDTGATIRETDVGNMLTALRREKLLEQSLQEAGLVKPSSSSSSSSTTTTTTT